MVNIEDLNKIQSPDKTATYIPILHKDLAELVLEEGDKHGFKVRNTDYSIAKEGNIMRGILLVLVLYKLLLILVFVSILIFIRFLLI